MTTHHRPHTIPDHVQVVDMLGRRFTHRAGWFHYGPPPPLPASDIEWPVTSRED